MKNINIKKYVLFGVFLFTLLFLLQLLFDARIPKNNNRKPYWILNKKNQIYDYIILGSSRTYTGIIPDTLEKFTSAKNIINLSLNGTTYPELYYLFKKFISSNKVSNLILLSDIYTVDNNFLDDPIHPYFYFPFIGDGEIDDILKKFYPENYYFWKWIPFLKYSEYNDFVGYRTFIGTFFTKENSPFEKTKGYQLNPGIISTQRIENIENIILNPRFTLIPNILITFKK